MCTGEHPFIPAENTAKVRFVYDTPGGQSMNVIYFQNTTGWSAESLLTLLDEVNTAWESTVKVQQSEQVTLLRMDAIDVSREEGETNELFVLGAGAVTNPVLPSNVTVAISFRTGFNGRSRR